MASPITQDIALTIDENNGESKEITLKVKECITKTNDDNNNTKNKSKILSPGDELMTRDEVPLQPTYLYVLFYLFVIVDPIVLIYLSYEFVEGVDTEQYVIAMASMFIGSALFGWFIGAVFYNLCGMPSNYTRKIAHIIIFVLPVVTAGGIDAFVESESSAYDEMHKASEFVFVNITLDVLWAFWANQSSMCMQIRPTRKVANYICGDTRSKRKCRWCNCCENTMDALERPEDRPNHILWIQTQMTLTYFVLFALSFWWSSLNAGLQILIPTIIGGFGDGLAEPVGVKFGSNCCGKDNRYKAHGCCTKYDYTRSVAGSSMVLLSGYLGVAVVYSMARYTMWQFVIAMVIVPPIGCIVEAKAPHTLDNPFIAAIVGIVATSILYIPL
eukprot:460203_1